MFSIFDKVEKIGGDYQFVGTVVSVVTKLSREVRFVVEDDRGLLHIFSEKNLRPRNEPGDIIRIKQTSFEGICTTEKEIVLVAHDSSGSVFLAPSDPFHNNMPSNVNAYHME